MYYIVYPPYLNKGIQHLSKKDYNKLLFTIFIFCSVITTITDQDFFTNSRGFSLVNFVFLYLIGGYVRKFENELKLRNIWTLITIFVGCFLFNFFLYRLGIKIFDLNIGFSYIGETMMDTFMNYDNPLVIIGSIAYFLIFGLFKFKSKIINILYAHVLDVYMIHETPIFRPILYSFLGLTAPVYASRRIIFKAILIAIIIFVCSTVFAYVVEYFIKLIKHIIKKLGVRVFLSKKFRKINNFFNENFILE